MNHSVFERAKVFMYRNARPLDMARFQYHFEGGSREAVMQALSCYQNADGGFGHALEDDVWNPASIPIGTWKATEIIARIGGVNRNHPVVLGILRYLESKSGFDSKTEQWTYTIPSNNDYPHAIWWEHKDMPKEFNPNPNAALAGFIAAYGDKKSELYQFGLRMIRRSFDYMVDHCPIQDEHVISCYISLYNYLLPLKESVIVENIIADMETYRECLCKMVDNMICTDYEKWGKEYVSMPSTFIRSPESFLYKGREELVARECENIQTWQLPDGSFLVPWSWWTDYKEYEIAINWWKSEIITEKFLFLKQFGFLKN